VPPDQLRNRCWGDTLATEQFLAVAHILGHEEPLRNCNGAAVNHKETERHWPKLTVLM